MSESTPLFGEAMRLLHTGRAAAAMEIGERLLADPRPSSQLAGHLCVGLVFEEGGADVGRDLDAALLHFHEAAAIAENSLTLCYLARVSMKRGEADYGTALGFLQEAERRGDDPEILLGFAHYYRTKADPQLDMSKQYYLRAARRGRFAGFFGYSAVCRLAGQHGRALAADVARVVSGPFIALIQGRAAQDDF